jgi:hypothetical protein
MGEGHLHRGTYMSKKKEIEKRENRLENNI